MKDVLASEYRAAVKINMVVDEIAELDRAWLVIMDALNLGRSVELIPNSVETVEMPLEKRSATFLMSIASHRQFFDLPDKLTTNIGIEFYADPKDAYFKGLMESNIGELRRRTYDL